MTHRIVDLRDQLREQETAAMLAEGSVIEALRNGQFDRAHQAIEDARAAGERRLELCDEAAELIDDGAEPE